MCSDEVGFLAGAELRLPAALPTTGASHLHTLAGSHPDEVGLEFGDHGQDVEQQPADGVGGIMDGSAEVELDLAGGELVSDVASIGEGAGEPIELGHHEGVAAGQAASASRRPGRARVVPVRPWST